jgi:hypothetical protein
VSDPSAELMAAIKAALEADAALAAAMGGDVKVYDVGPTNARKPYLILANADVSPDEAECIEGAETDVTLDVWSLTEPPGQAQAMTIAAAAKAAMMGLAADLPSHRLLDPIAVRVSHLIDLVDGKTAHSVVTVRFPTEPL